MRSFFSALLIILAFQVSSAERDSTKGSWDIHLRGDYGFIIAHRPTIVPLQEEHVRGFEVSFARPSNGKSEWENVYHFPERGFTLAFFDLGSPDKLGKGIAIYPFFDFPLGRTPTGKLHLRYGMGLGYVQKIFNSQDNFKNAAIGSHFNGIIHIDLHYETDFSPRSSIEAGIGITHFSNGSVNIPNLGINIATVNLAIHHSFGKRSLLTFQDKPVVNKRPQFQIYTGGFIKRIYPPLGKTFFAWTLSAMRLKPISYKSAWGIGADLFYDNSLSYRIERQDGSDAKGIDNFRPGIYAAYQLSVDKFGFLFNMGYYLYTKWKDDGNIYHRICVYYYFEKLFLCLNLKTHYARADFLELGVGYRIRNN